MVPRRRAFRSRQVAKSDLPTKEEESETGEDGESEDDESAHSTNKDQTNAKVRPRREVQEEFKERAERRRARESSSVKGTMPPAPAQLYKGNNKKGPAKVEEHRWINRRVRCKDCECKKNCDCEGYMYGSITAVNRHGDKMKYMIRWDDESFEEEEYDYRSTLSLLTKGGECEAAEDDMPISSWASTATRDDTDTESEDEIEEDLAEIHQDRAPTKTGKLRYKRRKDGLIGLTSLGKRSLVMGSLTRRVPPELEKEEGEEEENEEEKEEEDLYSSNSESDDDSDTEESQGSYRSAAKVFLTSSLRKRTKQKYSTSMRAFRQYMMLEGLDLEALKWDPALHDETTKSHEAEVLFMGFIWYCVEERGVKVSTASSYKTNVITQLSTASGVDLKYGRYWGSIRRLVARLKDKHGDKKKTRLPLVQQHLTKIWKALDAMEAGQLHREARYEALEKMVRKLGTRQIKALLSTMFFGANRGRDVLPADQNSFKDTEDCTVSDVQWTSYGHALRIKRTKVGANEEFNAKPYARVSSSTICPVKAMEEYLAEARDEGRYCIGDEATTPLFIRKDGKTTTTSDLYVLVKACTEAIGLDKTKYATHSLRIGGATAALACDLGNEYVCNVLGYWVQNSEAMRQYTRPTEENMVPLLREMARKQHTSVMQLLE